MKIQGRMSADVVGISIKRNKSHDGQEANLDLEVGVTKDQCGERFGEDFAHLAFASMQVFKSTDGTDADRIGYLQDSIKPGKRAVFEHHDVKLVIARGENGSKSQSTKKLRCQPDVINITPVDGEAKVTVRIRLPIEAADVAEFVDQVGRTLKVEFDPRQGELGFEAAKSNGNGRSNGNGHDHETEAYVAEGLGEPA